MRKNLPFVGLLALSAALHAQVPDQQILQSQYAGIRIDDHGFITSIIDLASGRDFSPPGHPSPLMSLHESGQANDQLLTPESAIFTPADETISLSYGNGSTAVVKIQQKDAYFRFQLLSLTPRGDVDNIVWGPVHTTVSKLIGDIIGVVRQDDWAIGLHGIDDNTIAGPVTDGDCYGMGYYIHSPDPVKYPLPPEYTEGQWFNIGGNGVNDVAFYSHPEEYFRQVFGTGAILEPEFGSTVAYHARDRRRSYVHHYSLLPGFDRSRPRTMTSDPIEGVDFIGSTVALYACPDDEGLNTIESIILDEGLPHPMIDGKWIRDPASFRPTVYWSGSRDKCIEYTKALGLKDISQDTGEFYPNLGNNWTIGNVGFSNGSSMPFKDFTTEAHKQGLTNGGLHTLCLFLQGGISNDVTPVPNEHLQTVCRTTLTADISATATTIEVTDPTFLAEVGTWPNGDGSNFLRVGGEMMRYSGISATAPWIIQISERGHASTAQPHQAGDELVKLQQNCYNGFVPDMERMPDYADYYADLMFRNGMDTINFDGFESTVYLNHGYYGTRLFCRRLFETYAALTGGRVPRVTGSNVFTGAWEYMNVCDVGGGDNMFNAASGRRAIEGKDIGDGFSSSYFPATFGIQGWHSEWSLYDAENLQAKAVGWEATYAFSLSETAVERSGEKDRIFRAFRAWQELRGAGLFTKAQKEQFRDPDYKFHIEQAAGKLYVLHPVKELRASSVADATPTEVSLANPYDAQSMEFSLLVKNAANNCHITLPGDATIDCDQAIAAGSFIICRGTQAYLADNYRKKVADLTISAAANLPAGDSTVTIGFTPQSSTVNFELTVWALGPGEAIGVGEKSSIVAHYKMGELEIAGGATVGSTPTAALPTVGAVSLPVSGSPVIAAGGPSTARGGSSYFMNFDGGTQRFEVSPNLIGAGTTSGWIIEAWVRPQPGGSGLGYVVSHGNGSVGQALNYDAANDKYGWFVGGVGQINGSVGASGIGSAWDHLALVRDGGTTRLYVNGILAGENAATSGSFWADGCAIGSQYTGGSNHGFTGDIDEVYFSTVSNFDPAVDLHMIDPPDPGIGMPYGPVAAGTITVSTVKTIDVPVSNQGASQTLTLSAVDPLAGDTGRFILQTPLPLDIAPGETRPLTFHYDPGPTAADHSATFSVANNSDDDPVPNLVLTGSAITDPNIVIDTGDVDFGAVSSTGGPVSRQIQVFNTGGGQNLITQAAIVSGDTGKFTLLAGAGTIPPASAPGNTDSSGFIAIRYDPSGAPGAHLAVLEITHNDPDLPSPLQMTMRGTGVASTSVIARYQLGEDDSSPATTVDPVGGFNLTNINASPGTSYNHGAGHGDSITGIEHQLNDVFNNADTPPALDGRTTNWGIQAWIRPEPSTGSAQTGGGYGGMYFGVGNGSRGGFSIFSADGTHWGMNIGGKATINSSVLIQGGTWTHLAVLAIDSQTRLYVNGVLATTYNGVPYAPNDAYGSNVQRIEIGGQTAPSYRSAAGVDEASIFTLIPEAFNPATDLGFSAPSTYASWASIGGVTGGIADDHDGDGVPNGIEYFMSRSAAGFTALPGMVDANGVRSVTWTRGADYPGVYGNDYTVQTATDLSQWTDIPAGDPSLSDGNPLQYTLPTGPTKTFVRLKVTGP